MMTVIDTKQSFKDTSTQAQPTPNRGRATGSPAELAQKFNMSERCIYRLIDELKSMGLEISYNRIRESYEYLTPVEIRFSLEIKDDNKKSVIGGQKYLEIFSPLPDFGSGCSYT